MALWVSHSHSCNFYTQWLFKISNLRGHVINYQL